MSKNIRDTVVRALDEAVGIMRDPESGPALLRGEDVQFSNIEIDSLSMFEMLMFIEEELGIDIDLDEVEGLPSVDALVRHLDTRTG